MPNPLPAREALAIVQLGNSKPGVANVTPSTRSQRVLYRRALAVLSALVDAHEALELSMHYMHPDLNAKIRAGIAWYDAHEKLRRLERGENEEDDRG